MTTPAPPGPHRRPPTTRSGLARREPARPGLGRYEPTRPEPTRSEPARPGLARREPACTEPTHPGLAPHRATPHPTEETHP